MTETLSAGAAGPAPSAQKPVHDISQTRLRNSRERKPKPRIERKSQRSGAIPGGGVSAPRFARHSRVSGNVSCHQRCQRLSVEAGTPHRRAIVCRRTPPARASALTRRNTAST